MKHEKIDHLVDLVEEIKQVDAMIQLHLLNPSSTMRDQYFAKKMQLVRELISEFSSSRFAPQVGLHFMNLALSRFLLERDFPKPHEQDTQPYDRLTAALAS